MESLTVVIIIGVFLATLVIAAIILIRADKKAEANALEALEKAYQLNKEQKAAVKDVIQTKFSTLTPPSNPEHRVEVKIAKGRTQSSGSLQMNMDTSRRYRDSDAQHDVNAFVTSNLINTGVYIDSSPVYDEPAYQAPSRSYDSCGSSDYSSSSSSSSSSDGSSCSSSSSD